MSLVSSFRLNCYISLSRHFEPPGVYLWWQKNTTLSDVNIDNLLITLKTNITTKSLFIGYWLILVKMGLLSGKQTLEQISDVESLKQK